MKPRAALCLPWAGTPSAYQAGLAGRVKLSNVPKRDEGPDSVLLDHEAWEVGPRNCLPRLVTFPPACLP